MSSRSLGAVYPKRLRILNLHYEILRPFARSPVRNSLYWHETGEYGVVDRNTGIGEVGLHDAVVFGEEGECESVAWYGDYFFGREAELSVCANGYVEVCC